MVSAVNGGLSSTQVNQSCQNTYHRYDFLLRQHLFTMAAPSISSLTFDHVGISCPASLFEDEIKFYKSALGPLGIREHFRMMPLVSALGNGAVKPDFWVSAVKDGGPIEGPVTHVHIGFLAKGMDLV